MGCILVFQTQFILLIVPLYPSINIWVLTASLINRNRFYTRHWQESYIIQGIRYSFLLVTEFFRIVDHMHEIVVSGD